MTDLKEKWDFSFGWMENGAVSEIANTGLGRKKKRAEFEEAVGYVEEDKE